VGGNRRGSGKKGNRHHGHDHDHDHGGVDKENGAGMGKGKARKRSPNAYEKQPHYVTKPSSGGNGGV
jgi:protein phosphatase 1 regulatory subunit 11